MSEFITLVREMRQSQREYFKTRSKDALKKSIALEKQVDTFLSRINDKEGNA